MQKSSVGPKPCISHSLWVRIRDSRLHTSGLWVCDMHLVAQMDVIPSAILRAHRYRCGRRLPPVYLIITNQGTPVTDSHTWGPRIPREGNMISQLCWERFQAESVHPARKAAKFAGLARRACTERGTALLAYKSNLPRYVRRGGESRNASFSHELNGIST